MSDEMIEEGLPLSLKNMYRGGCAVCSLVVSGTKNKLEAQVALLYHIGRVHKEEYSDLTGHEPTPEWLYAHEQLMRHHAEVCAGSHSMSDMLDMVLTLVQDMKTPSDIEDYTPGGYL